MANDVTIILTIMVIFIGLGTIMPFIEESLEVTPTTTVDTEGYYQEVAGEAGGAGVSIFTVLLSILKMFTWTFGSVPLLIDALFLTPIRIAFVFLVARNIWVGGGA